MRDSPRRLPGLLWNRDAGPSINDDADGPVREGKDGGRTAGAAGRLSGTVGGRPHNGVVGDGQNSTVSPLSSNGLWPCNDGDRLGAHQTYRFSCRFGPEVGKDRRMIICAC